MKFLLNSFTHTLPTQDNLKLWGKIFSDSHLCKNRDLTTHCLNSCRVSLNQVRFTWRHNNIVNYIVQSVDTYHYPIFKSDVLDFNSLSTSHFTKCIFRTDSVFLKEDTQKCVFSNTQQNNILYYIYY